MTKSANSGWHFASIPRAPRVPLNNSLMAFFKFRTTSSEWNLDCSSKVAAPDSSGQEMKVICRIVMSKEIGRILTCLILLVCYQEALTAQDAAAPGTQRSGSTLHLKHILGFEDMSRNANGNLSIQGGYLRFQKTENSSAQIPISSIQDLTLGEQDKQVGGVPMMLMKTAAPYEGGQVISLFSHKKYDTITLEYVDPDGGLHGAIFQLNKGEGQVLRSELDAAGAHITRVEDGRGGGTNQGIRNEVN